MKVRPLPPQVLNGVEVAVAAVQADVLLAVRQAFVRYFHQGLSRPVPVAVVPQEVEEPMCGLARDDVEMIERCTRRVEELDSRLGEAYQFYVAVEEGIATLDFEDSSRRWVRTWSVVRGSDQSAAGASGSIEVPARVFADGLADDEGRRTSAGLRRHEGLVSALTGAQESRRSAAAEAAFNALAALYYEIYSGHPRGAR